jgi:hypothetical protein
MPAAGLFCLTNAYVELAIVVALAYEDGQKEVHQKLGLYRIRPGTVSRVAARGRSNS